MQITFGLRASALGVFLLAGTTGALFTSFNSGWITQRLGIGKTLTIAFVLRGSALIGIMIFPRWELMVVSAFFLGMGAGSIDAGLNTFIATFNNNRLMNWLHGCFGIGALTGPLMMSALFSADLSWRIGYGVVGVLHLFLAVLFWTTRALWIVPHDDELSHESARNISPLKTFRLPIVWVGIAIFMLYAGLEVSAGNWSFSLFTIGRGIEPGSAALWVSLYWGSFTFGRFFFGALGDRLTISTQIRGALAGAIFATLLIWLNPTPLIGLLGLGLLGFCLAPAFPVLIGATPKRVGKKHAANAIGFQVGAAGIGVGVLPWLAGLLVENYTPPLLQLTRAPFPLAETLSFNPGLEVIGVFLVALSLILTVLYFMWERA
jgi:fucose permease